MQGEVCYSQGSYCVQNATSDTLSSTSHSGCAFAVSAYGWRWVWQDLVVICPKTQVRHFYLLLNPYALKEVLAATQVVGPNLRVTDVRWILKVFILSWKSLHICHLCLWKYALKCFAESEPTCGLAHIIWYRVKSIAKSFTGLRKQFFPDTQLFFFAICNFNEDKILLASKR